MATASTGSIVDRWGNPYKASRPDRNWAHKVLAKHRNYSRLIKGLNPDTVWALQNAAYQGDTSGLQSVFEQMVAHDGHLANLDQRRRGTVAGLEWEFRPYLDRPTYQGGKKKEPEKPDPKDEEICNFVQDVIWRIPDLQDHIKSMLDAIGKGFSVLQIRWIPDGGILRPYLRAMPQRLFTFRYKSGEDEVTSEWPRLLTDAEPTYGVELDPTRYLVSLYCDRNSEPFRSGVFWQCLWYWLRKHEAWAQFMATGERFCDPGLLGYVHPDDWNSQIPNTIQDILDGWGPGANNLIPGTGGPLDPEVGHGAYIQNPQANLRIPQDFWMAAIKSSNDEMTKAFAGSSLATDLGSVGARSAVETFRGAEQEDIRKPDFDWWAMGGMTRLMELIVLFNKGEDASSRLPYLYAPDLDPEEDRKLNAEVLEITGRVNFDNVLKTPPELRDRLGLPEMEQPEETPEPGEEPPTEPPPAEEGEPEIPEPFQERAEAIVSARAECSCDDLLLKAPPGIEDIKRDIAGLLAKIDPLNREASEQIRDRVTTHLLRMKRAPKTPQAFQRSVLRIIEASYEDLAAELEGAGLGPWFEKTYKHYKTTDRAIWPTEPPPVALQFGLRDVQSAKHMAEQAYWHFSRFTDNETYRKSMQNFLTKAYMDEGAPLFVRNTEVVKKFATKLGETTKGLADHEIDRIARTSVARAREQARIMQMADAGISSAEVMVHPDACEICRQYAGTTIDVASEVSWMEHLETLSPEEYHKALRNHSKQALKGVPPHEFQMSGGGPLYHPNCRCGVSMK